jgi:hypothetical protein
MIVVDLIYGLFDTLIERAPKWMQITLVILLVSLLAAVFWWIAMQGDA